MARSLLAVTDAYQVASAKAAVFTIKKVGKGTLFFNDTNANDTTAEAISSDTRNAEGLQVEQRSTTNTYVRASVPDAGWEIIIDD
ncbi:hypothetical protein KAR91_31960 [Candidatus Pacearchaeota archaeon]|nr:hypothetical protein [Candidatus Pacearchaeota archaeon]